MALAQVDVQVSGLYRNYGDSSSKHLSMREICECKKAMVVSRVGRGLEIGRYWVYLLNEGLTASTI
jgi:hypothetical protein